ncbi:hypothetical protein XM34_28780, partial [Bacillus anthracis]
TVLSVHIQKIK